MKDSRNEREGTDIVFKILLGRIFESKGEIKEHIRGPFLA